MTSSIESIPERLPLWIRVFSWFLALATLFLVISGGQVTSTDSGDAVPTWPLPVKLPMVGGVAFELGHRQIAASVGLATILMFCVLSIFRCRVSRAILLGGGLTVALVLIQALLGGLRVLLATHLGTHEGPVVTAFGIGHAMLGQIYFSVMVAMAYFLWRPRGFHGQSSNPSQEQFLLQKKLNSAVRIAFGALILQLFFGALLRLIRPGPVTGLVLLHMVGAIFVLVAVIEVIIRIDKLRETFPFLLLFSRIATLLIGVQILLGFIAYFAVAGVSSPASPELTWRTVLPTLHVGVGAILLANFLTLILILRVKTKKNHALQAAFEVPAVATGEHTI